MEILPIIGQPRPQGEATGTAAGEQEGLFASLLSGGEISGDEAVEDRSLTPALPEFSPIAPEQDLNFQPPSPPQSNSSIEVEPVEPEALAVSTANPTAASSRPASPEIGFSLGSEEPALPNSPPVDLGNSNRESLPASAEAPHGSIELPGGTNEGERPPRQVAAAASHESHEGNVEPQRAASLGDVVQREGQVSTDSVERSPTLAAEANQRPERDVRTQASGATSVERVDTTAPRTNDSGLQGQGNGARNQGSGGGTKPEPALVIPNPSSPQSAVATEALNAPSLASLGSQGTAPISEGANFTDALDRSLSRTATVPGDQPEQLAIRIQKAVQAGQDRISLRLHPAELGRIDVQLDIAEDGRLRAAILAERSEALDLLQRDVRLLERALQDAGLKTDPGGFTFDLREQSAHDKALSRGEGGRDEGDSDDPEGNPDEALGSQRSAERDGLLDIVV